MDLSNLTVVSSKKSKIKPTKQNRQRKTDILKGFCGVIGWFQVAVDIGLPLK